MPYTLNGLMLWVWLAHRSRGSVTALFSLFEKAMLSASQNDITLRAPYWSPRTKRPYLKKQSTQLMLQECSILLAQCLGKQAPHAYPVVQCTMMCNVKKTLKLEKNVRVYLELPRIVNRLFDFFYNKLIKQKCQTFSSSSCKDLLLLVALWGLDCELDK